MPIVGTLKDQGWMPVSKQCLSGKFSKQLMMLMTEICKMIFPFTVLITLNLLGQNDA